MTYIISPFMIYAIALADEMKDVLDGIMLAAAICAGISWIACFVCWCDDSIGRYQKPLRVAKASTIVLVIVRMIAVFIPSSETLLMMWAGQYATFENAELAIDSVKSAVDYVVNAISAIK